MFYPSKTNVTILQTGLFRAKYYNQKIDGIYGDATETAVNNLKRDNNLAPESDLSEVLNFLKPYLSGYIIHTVSPNDTLYKIAEQNDTSVNSIMYANPEINENNLQIGQKIIVPITPYATFTDINYSSFLVDCVIDGITKRYPFVNCIPIGKSVLKNTIYLLKIGTGEKQVFFNAEHHANEWITTPLVLKFIEDYALAYASDSTLENTDMQKIYNSVTLFAVCAINPDGIDIVNDALSEESFNTAKQLSQNYPNIPFPNGWKANMHGVDLNLQYPAGWENAKRIKYALGYTLPGPRDFVGSFPLSEPESRAIYNLTVSQNFILTISYHTQGGIIYWKYLDFNPENSQKIADALSKASGYALETTPYSSGYAGYKDWFIQTYNLPGYTVEAGYGTNPLPLSDFDSIYENNRPLMVTALSCAQNLI